jgi:hypothetical protein
LLILFELLWASIAGLLSACIMTCIEYPFWRKWGMQGVAEWQINWVMVSRLSKNWKMKRAPVLSWTIASHLFHGIVAGAVFRLLLAYVIVVPTERYLIILSGIVFGFALWFLFTFLMRGIYESVGKITITRKGLFGALLSDSVYGFVLGLLISFFG